MAKFNFQLLPVWMIFSFIISGTCQQSKDQYQLVWSDEFDKDGAPDNAKWSYDLGDGCPEVCRWGNNELQYYTKEIKNAHIKGGYLVITALKEPLQGYDFTSSRLVTKQKGDFLYGKVEARAKLPVGKGTWPAIWMLPTVWKYGGWPGSGEIDIMEHVGYEPDSVYGTVHTQKYNHILGTQKSGVIFSPTTESSFHTYGIEWDESAIHFFMDGKVYHTFTNDRQGSASWPFDQPFHLIVNLAVGGNWGGKEGVAADIWPQEMLVDYIRVYQKKQ
ncbi:MAG: glycoside hydrolase family 16 protein [Saprospiraceae bacterium]|jgi:beta-glucanase (GH16 family)|nr:glycoside hydrolase family 16 protein [Saprospiraceae bacterium]